MWRRYEEQVQFLVVYIREAHAVDGFLPKGGGADPVVEDPTSVWERAEVARVCMSALALEPMPAVVDTIDDVASNAYDAWPDRLYLIGRDGRVAYQGGPGPDGFLPDELERAIVAELGIELAEGGEAASPTDDVVVASPERERAPGSEPAVPLPAFDAAGIPPWTPRDRGFVRHDGAWVRADDVARIEDGWLPVDLSFVPPSDAGRVERGLYPCGGRWLDEADADDYHSRLLRWWRIPGRQFVAYSTASRRTTEFALQWMDSTWDDMVRLFGVEPELPPTVVLLRSLVQYNAFGITRPEGDAVPPEVSGFSALHHAFPCESWVDLRVQPGHPDHPGAAAAYWDDTSEVGNRWGPLAVRHAAAQAFVESIDPSPGTIRAWCADPIGQEFPVRAFRAEKRIPLWLRYGAAMYVERLFVDRAATEPLWARRWSIAEITAGGGLGDLAEVFACALDQSEVGRSRHTMLRAGLVVAFVLDGGVAEVEAAHARLKRALAERAGVRAAVVALERAVAAHERDLRAFARPK